jgi:hypothetical protein
MPVITSPSGVDLLTTTYLLLTQLNPEYSWLLEVRTGFEPVIPTSNSFGHHALGHRWTYL